jgi:hypothetical protein
VLAITHIDLEMKGNHVLKEAPDHHDADLVLKIYDLRREPVMRESRTAINTKFWPRNADEAVAVTKNDHPLNLAYRQTTAYWEMVYSMARHGIVHSDFLVENNTEGLFLFARVEPYLERIRQAGSPRSFRNTEWVATNTGAGKVLMEGFRARVKQIQSSS